MTRFVERIELAMKSLQGEICPMPIITVVVPFYNVEEYVDDCIRSLLTQDFQSYEVICVDDGSTDGTGRLLDDFAKADSRMRVLHTENRGLSEARNAGAHAAQAPFVTFVDGDDVVSPHYLKLLYEAHGEAPGRMVIGKARSVIRNEIEVAKWSSESKGCRILSREDAIRAYLRWEIDFVAWGRLVSRDLYLREPFEPGCCMKIHTLSLRTCLRLTRS